MFDVKVFQFILTNDKILLVEADSISEAFQDQQLWNLRATEIKDFKQLNYLELKDKIIYAADDVGIFKVQNTNFIEVIRNIPNLKQRDIITWEYARHKRMYRVMIFNTHIILTTAN